MMTTSPPPWSWTNLQTAVSPIPPLNPLSFSALTLESVLDPQGIYSAPPSQPSSPSFPSSPSSHKNQKRHSSMSAYFTTHHFSPHWTTLRASDSSSQHQQQQVHPPRPQPITTTITAPSIAPPESSAANATPSTSHRHLTLDTLARLLHDFHLANTNSSGDRDPVTHRSIARPHFDLLENKTTYAIYGELSGLSRQDVGVEVNDHLFTVTISGHLKRLVPLTTTTRPELSTAEEEDGVGVVHRDAAAVTAAKDNATAEGETAKGEETAKTEAPKGDKETEKIPDYQKDVHWHVTERKVGEFRRAFQFPIDSVDMSGVRASMKDGLLCVVVPKRMSERKEGAARKVEVV